MENIRQNIELELLFTTSSNRHVQVTVTTPLLFPGQILGSTEIRRGQIEKITLDKSLSGEKVEHSNKGVLITATEEITVFGVNKSHLRPMVSYHFRQIVWVQNIFWSHGHLKENS